MEIPSPIPLKVIGIRPLLVIGLALVLNLNTGCSQPWYKEPPLMEGKVTAVGMSNFVGNEIAARRSAETNGRATLAAFVKTQIQSLTETWAKQAGSDKAVSSVSNYFNDETVTRELINTTLRGSRPVKYEKHGKYFYVLMVLDTDLYAKYWKKVGAQALEAEKALLKSQAMKEDYLSRMDRLIKDYLDRVSPGLRAQR